MTAVEGKERLRLDVLLAERGLYPTRSKAAAAVIAGEVMLGAGRARAAKPGQLVESGVEIDLAETRRFVSRGGIKLDNALVRLGIDVAGKRCLDIGASTGGFTDCLLQRGAESVVALDVAYGELAWELRQDPRVVVIERTNARGLTAEMLSWAPDLVVCDLSFISLSKVLPAIAGVLAPAGEGVLMVKPQFEVGRGQIGKGGVVRDPKARKAALLGVADAAAALDLCAVGFASSGLPGPKGNRETFIHVRRGARVAGGDPAAMLEGVEL